MIVVGDSSPLQNPIRIDQFELLGLRRRCRVTRDLIALLENLFRCLLRVGPTSRQRVLRLMLTCAEADRVIVLAVA